MNITRRWMGTGRLASAWNRLASPLLLALVTALALGGYLFTSSRSAGLGFPLDDAWIHQTYARNLAQTGQWAYLPDEPSAGSTAPLWSLLLAGGYALKVDPLTWAYLLGGLSLWALALAGQAFFRGLFPATSTKVPWAGLLLAVEWHLVWAAASGMETVLYAALVMLVFVCLVRESHGRWAWVGLLVGLGVWIRPDAVTLLGPAGLVLMFSASGWRAHVRSVVWLLGGFLLLFIPYLGFNFAIQGSIWPNTFYAKQAEYAQLLSLPIITRLIEQLKLPLIGAGVFLLPGTLWFAWDSWRSRRWVGLAALAWFLGFAGIYALSLPVVYQYGRYLIPAMPVFLLTGLVGLADLFRRGKSSRLAWIITRTWAFSAAGVGLAFYGVVAGLYARDVAIIQTEMVAAARWVAANTAPDALIAAHDIGAMGYFGRRRLVDLAGLISPEVIPMIRDEDAIARWLNCQQVDYLVTFPGWYPHLVQDRPVVFKTGAQASPEAGGENMWVYRWKP